ncbi:MAG TPA: ESPR-type extended signal peptide-containing protein, partial [Rhodanobacteraceae bacterium]
MNRIYSLVWNRALHSVQVASELATSAGGGSAAVGSGARASRRHPLAWACIAALALGAFALPAWSATCPTGTVVIAPPNLTGTTGADGT